MALFEMLQNIGVFDKMLKGHYDEGSNCGFVVECEDTKKCIYRVCAPNRDAYGGTVYNSCVLACNGDPNISDFESFACKNPSTAWTEFGIQCEGYTPGNSISIFGRDISFVQIATLILFMVVIYVIIKRT